MSCQKIIYETNTWRKCEKPTIIGYPLCRGCFMYSRGVINEKFLPYSRRGDVRCCFFEEVPLAIGRSDVPHEDFIDEKRLPDYTQEYFLVGGYDHDIREATAKEIELATRYHIKVMSHA